MKKTNSIYIYRIIFTYMIVLLHYAVLLEYAYERGAQSGWYIAVEFFFMTTGYLMYDNAERYKEKFGSAWKYTLSRHHKLGGFKYLVAFAGTFAVKAYLEKITGFEIAHRLLDSVPEMLLLQSAGLARGWNFINPTLWYLSVIIIAGYVICWFLFNHKDLFVTIIAPIALVLGYSYLYRTCGSMDAVAEFCGAFGNFEMIHGFCDMCLGMYAAMLTKRLVEANANVALLKLAAALLTVAVIVLSLVYGRTTADFVFVGMIFLIVAFGFVPRTATELDAFFEKWSGITLNIYLIHEVFRQYIMKKLFPMIETPAGAVKATIVYLVFITVTAIALEVLYKIVSEMFNKFKAKKSS